MSKHKDKPPIPQKSAAVVAIASVNAANHHANIANSSTRSTTVNDNRDSLIRQRISHFEGINNDSKQVPISIRKNMVACSDIRRPRPLNDAANSCKRKSVTMLSDSKIFHQRYRMFETNIGIESQVLFNSRLKSIDCCFC